MADKFKDLFATRPTFVKGEQPTGLKFTQWAAQTDAAFLELEKAVGNMWGSFWIENDISPLLFNTIARAIGALDNINPLVPHSTDVTGYEQGTITNQRYLWLDLFPNGSGGTWLTASEDASIVPGVGSPGYKADRTQLAATGDWTVVGRKIYTYSPLQGAGKVITYNGTTGDGTGGTPKGDLGTFFTVMPHLAQLTGQENTACTVTQKVQAGETYYEVTTPLYASDYDGNEPIVGSSLQLELPLQAQLSPGEEIPHGIIRLWDAGDPVDIETAQPISDSARYYAVNSTTFHIKNVILEGMGLVDDYVNTRYFLVTSGSSLAETLGRMWRKYMYHTHDPYDFVPGVSHGYLDDLEPTGFDVQGGSLSWLLDYSTQSIVANNHHPHYLYREGYQPTDDGTYFNAMVGHLCVASSTEYLGDRYANTAYDSWKLFFGYDSGPYIFWDAALDRMNFKGIGSGFQFGRVTDGPALNAALFKGAVTIEGDVTCQQDLSVGLEFSINGYMVDTITNNPALTGAGIGFAGDPNTLVTEYAIKYYVDTEVAKPLDIPTGETILFETDAIVAGYTKKIDKDDMIVYITESASDGGSGEAGATDKTGGVWGHTHTVPALGDHNHMWYDPYGDYPGGSPTLPFFDENGDPRPHPGNGPENIIHQARKDKGLGGPLYTSNGTATEQDTASNPTYRMPGRNFTRQTRN